MNITLTSSARTALLTLQQTGDLAERTQNRLATGRRVSNVIDDAVSYFKAKTLSDRSSDFSLRKDNIDQGIHTVKAALNATDGVDKLLKQIKGLVESARGQSKEQRASATTQFQELGKQINQLIKDASYNGLNLLTSTQAKLQVEFSERTDARIEIKGFDLNATANNARGLFSTIGFSSSGSIMYCYVIGTMGKFSVMDVAHSVNGASFAKTFDAAIKRLDKAIERVRGFSANLGSNVAILQTRMDFTKNYAATLTQGSDRLTLADLNEEAANMTALQTRQQLGVQALSFSNQQQQAIMGLLR